MLNDHLKDYLKLDPDFAKQASPLCAFGGRNAFFFRSTIDHQPYFFICPGYLLKFSQESYKENAINVLGHELAHAMHDSVFMGEDRIKEHFDVDVFAKNSRFTFNRYNVDARYTPFTDCMTKYYTPEAQSCESIVEYYAEKAIPTLLSLAQKQENKHYSKTEKTAFFAKFQNQLKAVYSNCKITGRWHGYDDEMISDQAANEITVARLKNIAPAKRAETLKSVYSLYCVMNVSLDLSHPPAEARISNVFHNPALRKLLGCTVDIPDGRPYCSFSTSSPGR